MYKVGPTPARVDIWWSSTFFLVSVHVLAAWGAFYWRPYHKVPTASLVMGFLVSKLGGFGITIGYHRLYSHRAFKAKFAVRVVLAALGSVALQGSIKVHVFSGGCFDCLLIRRSGGVSGTGYIIGLLTILYTIRKTRFVQNNFISTSNSYAATKGLFYSHIGWTFFKPNYERIHLVDREDLDNDPAAASKQVLKQEAVPLALSIGFVVPTLLGMMWGDPSGAFVWGGLIGKLAIWHGTWLVNSLAHWGGLQPYSDENTSRGNLILALLTFGEGSHNFHHSFPHDWRSGPHNWNWDPSKWIIFVLYRLGLVKGLRTARDQDLKEALEYMHFKKKHGVAPAQEDAPWTGETWDTPRALVYIESIPGTCVVVIDDYFVDVTEYLGEHPGGAAVLRKYSVRPQQDHVEASWAFDGGLKDVANFRQRSSSSLSISQAAGGATVMDFCAPLISYTSSMLHFKYLISVDMKQVPVYLILHVPIVNIAQSTDKGIRVHHDPSEEAAASKLWAVYVDVSEAEKYDKSL
ncbi:hypothetical protein GGX14DRAFT_396416 [Mycena pura]|uniref:Cytochrome b5 heme-binding domain-containing protein n=1 Tax=Mycena pura TaxID=153505 RepID=A0AAD6VCT6_9AGAR|nr:hypothetical protein GGX14DRAFT_396416 [Mycena pura]